MAKKLSLLDLLEINLFKLLENGCINKIEEREYYNKDGILMKSVVVKYKEDIPPQELYKIYETIIKIKEERQKEAIENQLKIFK